MIPEPYGKEPSQVGTSPLLTPLTVWGLSEVETLTGFGLSWPGQSLVTCPELQSSYRSGDKPSPVTESYSSLKRTLFRYRILDIPPRSQGSGLPGFRPLTCCLDQPKYSQPNLRVTKAAALTASPVVALGSKGLMKLS